MRRRVLAVGALLAATACGSGGGGIAAGPPPDKPGPAIVDVAVGGAETIGAGSDDPVTQAWPQLLFHQTLLRGAVLIDVAEFDATAAHALADQSSRVVRLAPTFVTVWLGLDDMVAGTPVAQYESELTKLAVQLRRNGRTTVLLGGPPTVTGNPTAEGLRPSYLTAVQAVAGKQKATFVDLSAVTVSPSGGGRFRGPGNLAPDQAGHVAAAAAVGTAARPGRPAESLSKQTA